MNSDSRFWLTIGICIGILMAGISFQITAHYWPFPSAYYVCSGPDGLPITISISNCRVIR